MHAPTLQDIAAPYLHLPTAIQTALMRVETHPTFRVALTKGALQVLKALVTRASASNGVATIRARVDRVAVEVNVSCKTVQRAIRVFEGFGWVAQEGEGRSRYGVFCYRKYKLSPELCELLELPYGNKKKTTETELSDGAVYADLSYKKDLQEISIKNRGETPITLPAAVADMPAETGILPTGVCKLLGIARNTPHKLEHVYTIAKPYLQRIGTSPARAFQYLKAMLTTHKQVDYASRAAQLTRTTAPDRHVSLSKIARECRYKRFVHVKTGMCVRFFDGTAEVSRDSDSVIYGGEQMAGLYRGVANGNLKEVIE